MERGSDKHGRLLDEQLERETRSMRQGAPVESRADERRVQEDGGDGEPTSDALLTSAADYGGLTHDEVEARSELARHLRPSIFPATKDKVYESARDLGAEPALLDALEGLPARTFHNVGEVWEGLGGHVESRVHDVGADAEPEPTTQRFEFAFDPLFRPVDALLGVTPERAFVEIDDERFVAQFGLWRVETPRSNIVCVQVTGPYFIPKVLGPPRLSFKDRGLTFATNAARGVCIEFRERVKGVDPLGLIRHSGLTVTVADPESLAEALRPD